MKAILLQDLQLKARVVVFKVRNNFFRILPQLNNERHFRLEEILRRIFSPGAWIFAKFLLGENIRLTFSPPWLDVGSFNRHKETDSLHKSIKSNIPAVTMTIIHTPRNLLLLGLRLAKHTDKRIERVSKETNMYRFRVHYGCNPAVAATIFHDLQTTTVDKARVPQGKSVNIRFYLMALNFLKLYPTEIQREAISPSYVELPCTMCWHRHYHRRTPIPS